MRESRVVRETTEYEDGTIEERVLSRRDDSEDRYESPKGGNVLMALGILGVGGFVAWLLWRHRHDIQYSLGRLPAGAGPPMKQPKHVTGETAPGGYWTPPSKYESYRSYTPRPDVGVDEFVSPIQTTGRSMR